MFAVRTKWNIIIVINNVYSLSGWCLLDLCFENIVDLVFMYVEPKERRKLSKKRAKEEWKCQNWHDLATAELQKTQENL